MGGGCTKTHPAKAIPDLAEKTDEQIRPLPPVITAQQFEQIYVGMTYKMVKDMIESDGEIIGESDSAGTKDVMVEWRNSDGSGAVFTFQNDRLVVKTQRRLP